MVIFLLKIIESRIFLCLNYYNKKGAFRIATTVIKFQYESAESQYVDLENWKCPIFDCLQQGIKKSYGNNVHLDSRVYWVSTDTL